MRKLTSLGLGLALLAGVASANTPPCPPGTAPQTTSHKGCVGYGPFKACYTYTRQTCEPVRPAPAPTPAPSPAPRPRR
jgi:hypothetical protein